MVSNGPLIELATLSEYAKHIQPKFIFWMWFEGNDLINLENEKKSVILMQYLDSRFTQDLFHRQDVIDNAILADLKHIIAALEKKTAENRMEKSNPSFNVSFSEIAKLSHLRRRLDSSIGCSSDIDPLLTRIMNSFKTRVDEWNGKLYFVYLPAFDRYEDKINSCVKKRLNMERDKVLAMAKEAGINIIDATELFDSHNDPLSLFPLRLTGHYNSEGYKIIASEIDNRIQ